MSKLFVVSTPIGNLGDISSRALLALKEADIILCEDTRVTKKLLQKYNIVTPTISYHAQSKLSKIERIFEYIQEGKNLALVSDAGTPTISDPGAFLISKIREEFGEQVEVISIPGASALTAALSIAGVPASEFLFLGFLPHKKGRETLFKEIKGAKRTVVFYESPHRIIKTLDALVKHLGTSKKVTLGRELTKIHEEVLSGTAVEVLECLENNKEKIRGEFVVMVS